MPENAPKVLCCMLFRDLHQSSPINTLKRMIMTSSYNNMVTLA